MLWEHGEEGEDEGEARAALPRGTCCSDRNVLKPVPSYRSPRPQVAWDPWHVAGTDEELNYFYLIGQFRSREMFVVEVMVKWARRISRIWLVGVEGEGQGEYEQRHKTPTYLGNSK